LVRLAGIEPTTPWFVAKYSIQLSYSRESKHSSSFILFPEELKADFREQNFFAWCAFAPPFDQLRIGTGGLALRRSSIVKGRGWFVQSRQIAQRKDYFPVSSSGRLQA
jgi:hypothetical protein